MDASDEGGAAFRDLPAVDRVANSLGPEIPHPLRVRAARDAVDAARAAVRAGRKIDPEVVIDDARRRAQARERGMLRPVINATGVLIHTNLGRVPLGPAQVEAVARAAGSYSNLEYDLEAGRRGSRHDHVRDLLQAATGCEACVVVNNNAAAVLVTLAALCAGREVVISRGELIEIGGEFRIPDVLRQSGARLAEVGTTNRTRLGDYERAITPETGALMKVHPSNYRIVGFTESVSARDLARLARGRGLPLIHDVGSGLLTARPDLPWAAGEPPITEALEDGADVVTASGDKLLGGPQAGLILGRRDFVGGVERHPLMRALRPDKMTLAALDATLRLLLAGRSDEIPLWRAAAQPADVLRRRAQALAAVLAGRGYKAEAVPTNAVTGGGSLPGTDFPSWGVSVVDPEVGANDLAGALRRADPPVIARIEDDRVLLDLRTVEPADDNRLAEIVARAALH